MRMGVTDARVLAAANAVDRADFLEPGQRAFAWQDQPVLIGYGQTNSQPSLIALTLQLAALTPESRVLEVGAGCGYQTALLSKLCRDVYAVDIVAPLVERARGTLARLGATNVHLRAADGYLGWPEASPFDAIIVAAGAPRVPAPLLEQLAPGGRLVIPVGPPEALELKVLTKTAAGAISEAALFPVRFVPLTGAHADADRAEAGLSR
ncbi:MAG: protein-L-isoaspartate(D-aspartate) O-methyltransferase [Myxococcaceae bacterium]|jgi:protein-L-isoaspartate(D-aspartate) O-methyltransferase|nr:protein-L-isoaspartate(D-aspartate) O-methyltransferase [Myxococcaceae bacterium]MCA3011191.1 protein-L-isoaspartate(D-aspartate) O-methyltransferase [Myxococcaceae bacterium]